jgi:hypothetical protein
MSSSEDKIRDAIDKVNNGEENRAGREVSRVVMIAMPWWIKSRRHQGKDPNSKLTELMHLLFRTLDALHIETRKLPFYAQSGVTGRPKDSPDAFIFALWLKDTDYIALRSILALCGDLIYVLEKLMTLPGLLELGQFMRPLHKRANQFRDARDFFTHMDEALRGHSKHGISGPLKLECGVEFRPKATNNVYVIWHYNALYFSFENKPRKIVLTRPEFDEIFIQARQLYAKIIDDPTTQQFSNPIHPDQVYPLN